jgi:hypothetical protein
LILARRLFKKLLVAAANKLNLLVVSHLRNSSGFFCLLKSFNQKPNAMFFPSSIFQLNFRCQLTLWKNPGKKFAKISVR